MENEIKHSVNFINKKVGNKNSFSVPNNYFKDLEDDFFVKITENNFSKEIGFISPDSYFDSLEDVIINKVTSEENKTKVISLKQRVLKVIPLVAAACVILFIGLNSFNLGNNNAITLDSLSDDDIEYWLESNNLNSNDIAIVLEEEILSENDFSMTFIEDKDLEDYMNSIDSNLIFEDIN